MIAKVMKKPWKSILDAQWSDDAVFTCVTEDDEKCSAKLDVIMQEKKVKKVEKPKEVIKKVEFDDKKSYEMVDQLFELKVKFLLWKLFWSNLWPPIIGALYNIGYITMNPLDNTSWTGSSRSWSQYCRLLYQTKWSWRNVHPRTTFFWTSNGSSIPSNGRSSQVNNIGITH